MQSMLFVVSCKIMMLTSCFPCMGLEVSFLTRLMGNLHIVLLSMETYINLKLMVLMGFFKRIIIQFKRYNFMAQPISPRLWGWLMGMRNTKPKN